PFAFAIPVVVEVILRFFIHQPAIPPQLYREGSYPLLNPNLPSSFPSGHTIRSSFLCVLGVALLDEQRHRDVALRWLLIALFFVAALSRVYLGTHWLSDVIAGACLGTTTGLWTAALISRRWRRLGH
ncbi:MAG TPA: phosphatase PAP2 family protein, partial [Chloroflexota bacterium]|nr:phosphatase PAP2 family protein [Chloroflexota bacterium]